MTNYKLLVFNEDYADEHNVPALACFNQEGYKSWLESKVSTINPDFEKLNNEYQEKLDKYNKYIKECQERGLWTKNPADYTKEDKEWFDANWAEYVSPYKKPKRGESKLCAWLGNSGDGFGDHYDDYIYAKELVEAGIVKVFDVDESFYKYFKLANLSRLSLCNVFEIEDYD